MKEMVTVIGGTGFVGRYVVQALAQAGYQVQVICRDTVAGSFVKTYGQVGQISLRYGDITKPETIASAIQGSFAVINLVGILFESGRQRFNNTQTEGPKKLAEMAKKAGVSRLIQFSALAVERAKTSRYAQSKLAGEQAVSAAFPGATILRPSLVIGAEDGFFQKFANLASLLPVLPLISGGHTRFQPVLVQDVATAVTTCLNHLETKDQTYELGGPEIYSFKELLEMLKDVTNRKICLVYLPKPIAYVKAFFFKLLPIDPLITFDQIRLLNYDNIVNKGAAGFKHLNIEPASVRAALPSLLARFIQS